MTTTDDHPTDTPPPQPEPTHPTSLPTNPIIDYQALSKTLSTTAENLSIQSIISHTLQEIISDVELHHWLEDKMNDERARVGLEKRCVRAEAALAEYRAMERERADVGRKLGEGLAVELMGLVGYVEELEERQRGGGVDVDGDGGGGGRGEEGEGGGVLLEGGGERDLVHPDGRDGHDGGGGSIDDPQGGGCVTPHDNDDDEEKAEEIRTDPATTGDDQAAPTDSQISNEMVVARDPIPTSVSETSMSNTSTATATATDETPIAPAAEADAALEASTTSIVDNDTSNSVVPQTQAMTTITEKVEEDPVDFQSLDADLLMKIFEFSDAFDILNVAQTNVIIYSMVDSIFGLGGSVIASSPTRNKSNNEDAVNGTDDAVDIPPIPPVTILEEEEEEEADEGATSVTIASSIPSTPNATVEDPTPDTNNGTTTTATKPSATMVTMPPPRKNASASSLASSASSKDDGNTSERPKKNSAASSSSGHGETSATPATTNKPTNTEPPKPPPPPPKPTPIPTPTTAPPSTTAYRMDPSVATSLAAKLSPTELTAIISLRDQLRKSETSNARLQVDVDDLTAQLVGTVSVKDVLTEKVRDLKAKLDRSVEDAVKVARQTSSDQEVIAFLDDRVQTLEKQLEKLEGEMGGADARLGKLREGAEKQVRVIKDMLTFEKDRLAECEREWRGTKKVLVKEVKHCRTQIMAVEAERDGYREENERLKEALRSITVGERGGGRRNGKEKR